MEKLVELGAQVDARDCDGGTALLSAVNSGQVEAVRSLLHRLGADPGVRDERGNTALHCAVSSTGIELVEAFAMCSSVDVNARGDGGRMPLHDAVCWGAAIVRLLISMGATLDGRCDDGATPLHYVCEEEDEEALDVVRVLLAAGADRYVEDAAGETPRQVAVWEPIGAILDSYFPITPPITQVLLGLGGPTESPLTRFSSHALFEPRVLALIKCLLTGEDKGAFSQLLEEVERS